jgi:methylthioribose-1-phosphate isomerase
MNVTVRQKSKQYRTVTYNRDRNEVVLIEQRLLPHRFKTIATKRYEETALAISDMVVRGAGAIGATAAYGLAQGVQSYSGNGLKTFNKLTHKVATTMETARPTAVDPANAIRQVLAAMETGSTVEEKQDLAVAAAEGFANDNVQECQRLGQHGARLIKNGSRILTHCNAGWLAFVDIGSATAPIYEAQSQGISAHVFCDETRPRLQGASLTAWELAQQGISHEIIADNAAGHLMQHGEIDLVITGADRVLGKTGEVTNKIGTYTKAVLAKRHKIPFYVAIPLSTIDWNLDSGAKIPIEERSADEVLYAWGASKSGKVSKFRISNPTSSARNPAFDVTPPELITGIITPAGILKPKQLLKYRTQLT